MLRCPIRDSETGNIPVIALSASATEKDIQKGLAAGFVDYLTRPLDVVRFMDKLAFYIQ